MPRPVSGGETVRPKGNPSRIFPRQTKSAAAAENRDSLHSIFEVKFPSEFSKSCKSSVTESLKRQKSRVLQSVNARAESQSENRPLSLVFQKVHFFTFTHEKPNFSQSAVRQSGLPQQSLTTISIMTDIVRDIYWLEVIDYWKTV